MLIILEQGEELVAVTMGKRDRDNQDSLTEVKDLTSQVSDGRVFVDVPNGLWCVNVIKTTRKGTGRKNRLQFQGQPFAQTCCDAQLLCE